MSCPAGRWHRLSLVNPADARVLLFDGAETVLAVFGDRLGARTRRDLSRLGVELHLGSFVTGMGEHSITVRNAAGAEGTFATATKVWAAGVAGSPLGQRLAEASGIQLDRLGRVPVEETCALPGHREVFVVGDLMTLPGLPGMAEVAMQSGRHVARLITRRLRGRPDTPLRYRDLGMMATISRFRGVAKIGPIELSGFLGWVLWLAVH